MKRWLPTLGLVLAIWCASTQAQQQAFQNQLAAAQAASGLASNVGNESRANYATGLSGFGANQGALQAQASLGQGADARRHAHKLLR